jgi:hypothetical protein
MNLQSTCNVWVSKYSGSPSLVRLDEQWVLETLVVRPSALVPIPAIAARAVLPAWKTTPISILLRETGLPSATVALEETKLRFATHLQTADNDHPLTWRLKLQQINRGRGAGGLQQPRTKVQRLGLILPETPPLTFVAPYYRRFS